MGIEIYPPWAPLGGRAATRYLTRHWADGPANHHHHHHHRRRRRHHLHYHDLLCFVCFHLVLLIFFCGKITLIPFETKGDKISQSYLIIRRAIGPVACEIISSRVVFVDPPYPPEEPREGKSKLPMMGGASGKSFLATQKIIKKSIPQKTFF